MKIEVRLVPEPGQEKLPTRDQQHLSVEVHDRRGDAFTVMTTHTVMADADKATEFTIPVGGRLVLTNPQTHEELVYDRDQAAAIRGSTQAVPHRADAPVADVDRSRPPAPATMAGAREGELGIRETTSANTNPTPTGGTQPGSNVDPKTDVARSGIIQRGGNATGTDTSADKNATKGTTK